MSIEFLKSCIRDGLAHSYDTKKFEWIKPYPEVTGYLLSYFSSRNIEDELCGEMVEALSNCQQPNGGWGTFNGDMSYFFDTVQICHGLIDYYKASGDTSVLQTISTGLDYLQSRIRFGRPLTSSHLLKSWPGMQLAFGWGHGDSPINSKVFEIEQKSKLINRSFTLQKIKKWHINSTQIIYTHPGAYQLEGLLASGHMDLVSERLSSHFLRRFDTNTWQIAYHPDTQYEYNSGSVQLAILLFKTGHTKISELIYEANIKKTQNVFAYGWMQYSPIENTTDLPHFEINSWGCKYLLELEELIS